MSTPVIDIKNLKKAISKGDLDEVLSALVNFTESTAIDVTTEIYLSSARYRQLENEKLRGEISNQDYKQEFNSITANILEILDSIDGIDEKYFKQVSSKEQIMQEIEDLAKEFDRADIIKSIPSMIRMKIHIARKMAEKFIQRPELMKEYLDTKNQAIICAIGRKIKVVPDIEDLYILEFITPNAANSVTKGFITNALAELIYSGQLRLGDDERMRYLLEQLGKEGDLPLLTNVERVRVALDYLTGRIQ